MRAADDWSRHLAQPDRTDLACLLGAHQRSDRFLDRNSRIETVQIIEIDMIRAEAVQRAVKRSRDCCRRSVERARPIDNVQHAFRGKDEFGPTMHDGFADQPLIRAEPI